MKYALWPVKSWLGGSGGEVDSGWLRVVATGADLGVNPASLGSSTVLALVIARAAAKRKRRPGQRPESRPPLVEYPTVWPGQDFLLSSPL